MRLPLPGNPADLQVSDADPTVCSIQTRVHSGASLKLQYVFVLVQRPDSSEGRVEMSHDRFHASEQNLSQVTCLGERSARVCPNTRLASQGRLSSLFVGQIGYESDTLTFTSFEEGAAE